MGIVHDLMLRELRLFTDCGRCCRPLFIVDLEAQRLAVTKDDIALLQDRESTNFGWSVGLSKPVCALALHGSRSADRRAGACAHHSISESSRS